MANLSTLLPLAIFFFFVLTPPSTCSSNQTDHHSLLAIKSNLQDPQGFLNSWNQTLHFCSWEGIQCSNRHLQRVVSINIMSRGLVGNLSPHVGNLSFLRTINLRNNSLHGPIPAQITLLRRLEFVDLSNNSFTGEIPRNLSRCPNLIQFVMTRNLLTGTIPTELGSLLKLEALAFSRNKLSGPIPSSIGNITTLKRLSLGSCGLTGVIPGSLSRLRQLEFLQLSENGLIGNIPNGVFNFTSMVYFDVSVNNLNGVIPSTIGVTLPNLAVLLLEKNQFSGPIPNSISNASLLEWIILSSNKFIGPIPNLERLTIIQDFFLYSNHIEDDMSFISSLTNSTKLERLDVSDNMLSGSLPNSIANLSTLISLFYTQENQINGSIPSGIGNLMNLEVFDLSYNLLDGLIPISMSSLSNLHTLFMGRNRFRGEVPSIFRNITLLSRFRLDGNRLSGNVPSSLGNCFTGSIPLEIMRLSSIAIALNLSYNAFVGSIPNEVGSLTNLAALDLSSNRLSGLIPSSLSNCLSLEWLYLDDNFLEGELPAGLSALMGLQELDLSKNNLSGAIPTVLGNLNLEKLNMSFNRLHGEIPTRGVFQNITSISLRGNQGLCGGNAELNFPPCSEEESPERKLSTLMKILIPILVIGSLGIIVFIYLNCKRRGNPTPIVSSKGSFHVEFMKLSYADLLKATGGFSERNVLGFGRFGSVYKGIFDDESTSVAVKVLDLAVRGASKSFMAECKVLGGIKHRNLVKLISVCDSMDFRGYDFKALVYELKSNGSLEKWLYNNEEGKRNLSMRERLNIAIDIAKGIEYLHLGIGSPIVHGDLKPSNILLDDEMVACVGDFGLAKIVSGTLPLNESNSSVGIKGTLGYVPPEYGTSDSVSREGDVYSYGIILLEMFANKRPTDDFFSDQLNLHNFVRSALPDGVAEIVDPQFQTGQLEIECLARVLRVGVLCSKEIPRQRMPINYVANELSDILEWYCR